MNFQFFSLVQHSFIPNFICRFICFIDESITIRKKHLIKIQLREY